MEAGDDHDGPGLDSAYSLETPADSRRLYDRWASTYDSDFIDANGYVYHEHVAAAFLDAGGSAGGAVLDVGCGTGIVGVALADMGETVIDGVDISPEMLSIARTKRSVHDAVAYRDLIEADVTDRLPFGDDIYAGVISVGTFTHGHLGPEPIAELVRVTMPSGVLAIGINAEHRVSHGFDAFFAELVSAKSITVPHVIDVAIYEAMDGPHGGDRASVALFQKRA